jgi:hydrogenase-4 component H
LAENKKKTYKFNYVLDASKCMACAACEVECKFNGIYIDDTANYAINLDNCTRCGKCFRACPSGAISKVNVAA